jgi:hypothetical protein
MVMATLTELFRENITIVKGLFLPIKPPWRWPVVDHFILTWI